MYHFFSLSFLALFVTFITLVVVVTTKLYSAPSYSIIQLSFPRLGSGDDRSSTPKDFRFLLSSVVPLFR